MSILFRTASLTPGTGRTVFGIAVPFGQIAEISEYGRTYNSDANTAGRSITTVSPSTLLSLRRADTPTIA